MNLFILFILGGLFGISVYIYVPKLVARFFVASRKNYEVNFTITHFFHPTETAKKGEYVRVKPVSIRINAMNEDEAIELANDVVHDNLKIEVNSIEEIG